MPRRMPPEKGRHPSKGIGKAARKPAARGAVGWKPARKRPRTDLTAERLLGTLEMMYPAARIELVYHDPLQLLVATILSAQSTDRTVNRVTGQLFAKYRTAADYASADPAVFETEIHSTGFFRAKARSILGAARMLMERFGGEVPRTMDGLVQLPGVARKTANVVLWGAFGLNEGVAVDTHVLRVSQRLGLAKCADPLKVEQDLMGFLPREKWGRATELLIFLGRYTCKAGLPDCPGCKLNDACPSSRV